MHQTAPNRATALRRLLAADALAQRRHAAWILAAAIGGFVVLALPFLLGRVYVADDLGEFHLPLRAFYSAQLSAGEPFDWMNSLYGGFYLTGEGQLGAYHPEHLLLYRLLPLGVAFNLELLVSYPAMFAGMYFFLRVLLRRRDAALFGALAFTFCGFNLLHFVHPNAVAIVAHLPWLLLAVEAAFTQPSGPRRATAELAIGLLVASQLLLGYPQYVWFSLITVAAYAAWRAVALRLDVMRLVLVQVMVLLGFAAAGVQLLPTIDALGQSTRGAADADFANTGALHPLNLVQLLQPYLWQSRVVGQNTHELGLYVGAVPFLSCVWLAARREYPPHLLPLVRAILIMAVAALLLSLGEAGILYRLQGLIPVVSQFRFPCRAIVLFQLCTAAGAATALAAMGHRLRGPDPRLLRRTDRALAIAVAASVALAIAGPYLWPQFVARPILVWSGPALITAAAILVALAERRVRGAFALLAVFAVADLAVYGLSYSVWNRTADLQSFIAASPKPPGPAGPRVTAIERDHLRTGDRLLLSGVHRIDGYAGLEPAKRLDYGRLDTVRLAGASFVWVPGAKDDFTDSRWLAIRSPAPRARLVSRTVLFRDDLDVAALLGDTAAVDAPLPLPEGSAGVVRILRDSPGAITLKCHAPTRQLLVTTESYHPGWRAIVDGRTQPVLPVNADFLGCAVEAGTHEVQLLFRPRSLQWGMYLSAGGLGLLWCTFAWRLRRRAPAIGPRS